MRRLVFVFRAFLSLVTMKTERTHFLFTMKRFLSCFLCLGFVFTQLTCTNFSDEGAGLWGVAVQVNNLVFSSSSSERSFSVTSGEKWSVLRTPDWLKISQISGKGFSWSVTLSVEENNGYNRSGTLTLQSSSSTVDIAVWQEGKKGAYVPVESVSLSQQELVITEGEMRQLTATVSPTNATVKNVRWGSSSTTVATISSEGVVTAVSEGTATITVRTEDGNRIAICHVMVLSKATSGKENGYYWVDLGIPSGLKWAICNVGASSPSEYGNYFSWGETSTKSNYVWSTYKWCNGSSNTLTKYNTRSDYGTVDNSTCLELSDDAARANWGGTWRMPTDDEWAWLRENCTWAWQDDYDDTGVKGMLVTSNVSGYTDNSIFLPAAGQSGSTSLRGNYWSSSLNESKYAWVVAFNSGGYSRNYSNRCFGLSVRPVTK